MQPMRWRGGIIGIAVIATLALTGCAYGLHPYTLPSQHKLKLVAKSPELYTIRLQTKDYPVATDGKVEFGFPAMGHECSVYLFGVIPIRRRADPFKAKTISVVDGVNIVRTFSLRDISKLVADGEGYRLLAIKNPH